MTYKPTKSGILVPSGTDCAPEPAPQVDTEADDEIRLRYETRPSQYTGFSHWLVLTYKDHSFEEILPVDYPAMTDLRQNRESERVANLLKGKLRPILLREDRELH